MFYQCKKQTLGRQGIKPGKTQRLEGRKISAIYSEKLLNSGRARRSSRILRSVVWVPVLDPLWHFSRYSIAH